MTIHDLRPIIILLLLFIPALVHLVLLSKLEEHRKKDRPLRMGESFSWARDVLSKSDYNERGRRLLPWNILSIVILVVAFISVWLLLL